MMNVRRWKLWLLTAALVLSLCACGPKPPEKEILPEEPPAPDPVGFLDMEYPEMPVLSSQEEIASYMVYNFLRGELDMKFYVDREVGADYDARFFVDNAQDSSGAYNAFLAYTADDRTITDLGDEEGYYVHFPVTYTHPHYDEEARAVAWAWVRDNPPPKGGFTDFETEKAYARAIHDFVACRVTYDPKGYDPKGLNGANAYENFQEAYNVLGEGQETAVCAGYAHAFALIAQYAGINATWVRGNYMDDGSTHAWNVVYPCDGSEPVTVDVTWDDDYSLDEPGQTEASDAYFYVPVSQDSGHEIVDNMLILMNHVNTQQIEREEISPEDAMG